MASSDQTQLVRYYILINPVFQKNKNKIKRLDIPIHCVNVYIWSVANCINV